MSVKAKAKALIVDTLARIPLRHPQRIAAWIVRHVWPGFGCA